MLTSIAKPNSRGLEASLTLNGGLLPWIAPLINPVLLEHLRRGVVPCNFLGVTCASLVQRWNHIALTRAALFISSGLAG